MPMLTELPMVFRTSVTLSVVLGVGCCAVPDGGHFGQMHSSVLVSIQACLPVSQAKFRPLFGIEGLQFTRAALNVRKFYLQAAVKKDVY
jgi:hypothetical protein